MQITILAKFFCLYFLFPKLYSSQNSISSSWNLFYKTILVGQVANEQSNYEVEVFDPSECTFCMILDDSKLWMC